MLALVEAPTVELETDRLHDLHDQGALLAGGELAGERQENVPSLGRDCLADQRRKAPREGLEHGVDISGRESRAELVHERIVWGEVERLSEQRRLVPHQVNHFLQVRGERVELAL